VQRLVDAAVVIVAMIVPPLDIEVVQEAFHGAPSITERIPQSVFRFFEEGMTVFPRMYFSATNVGVP
jgi:hypothetical protein